MRLALLFTMACRSPAQDTDTPDTDTDPPSRVEHWDTFITQLDRFGWSIAIVETEPELIVAIVRRGDNGVDGVESAQSWVFAVGLPAESIEERVQLTPPAATTLFARVMGLGDVTGDGNPDLGVLSNESHIEAGPFDTSRPPAPFPVPAGPLPCDADGVPPNDVCRVDGVDLGPIDGQLEVTWVRDPTRFSWNLAIGRFDGYLNQYNNFYEPRISHIPLELRGTVQVDELPAWTPLDLRPDAMAVLDAHADGSDHLLVCATPRDGATGLRLLDAFPADSPVRLELPAPCDALEVADFTGDGLPEVAVGTGSRLLIVDPRTWTVLAEHRGLRDPLQDGLGTAMDSADLDGDGRMDLLVGAPWVGRVYVLTEVVP